ncbi:hypothetical protein GCM10011494_16770 [Novosphingobium endophyticum]|uniref:Histidine kinase/HSP90-like ATPase domain-containing protein n=1 Tax=Novosphingobium endophyticum TaxID=1955250 RepID=A0A916X487_9SPHN|nr:hypothetical protein GCM10011494_16770 [Novosphingobium endophyticum]
MSVGGIPKGSLRRDIIGRLSNLSQLGYFAYSNLVIAASRTICAFVLLLFVLTEAPVTAFRFDFHDMIAMAYAGFAVLTLIMSFKSWYLDFTLSGTFIVIDIVTFVILIASRAALDASTVILALWFMAHVLAGSVLRWRSGAVLAVAVSVNIFWIADIVLFELPRGTVGEAVALRWIFFSVLVSLIVVWTSAQMLRASLPRFAGDAPRAGLPLAASAIDYAMQSTRASGAILCWIDPEDLGCHACRAEALEGEPHPEKLSFGAADAFRKMVPVLFDAARGKAIVSEDGGFVAHALADVPGYALFTELGVEAGLCIPVDGDEGRSWLILTGIPVLGWGHLRLVRAICSEIEQGMTWQTASVNALDSALFRLRRTVACDLHDSVAHSLAGARFLLGALRSRVGQDSEIGREIGTIKDALDAEHLHVRRLIEQLRETDSDPRVRNLVEDLDADRATLASRWQIAVDLLDSDFRVEVPVWLSLEVQQLVREAVSNGVRHGRASAVTVKCRRRLGTIEIEVSDNGCGFPDPENPVPPHSIGERLAQLGGSLKVLSSPGSTRLRMYIPSRAAD